MKKKIISLLSAIGLCLAGISTSLALAANETVKGDVNGDGRFTIADVVMFKKWLYGTSNTELVNWQAADLNEDGTLDVFDFCQMRREIIEKYDLSPEEQQDISSNSKSGNPGGVHTTLNVNYDEAKERFGYPIEECSRSDFLKYKVGIVSQNGNIDSKEAFCWDLTYEFTNGYIYIQDQDRSAGKLANPGIEQYEYKDRIFVTEDSYDDEYIRIGYYPTDMGGLAYCATFNKSVDMYEVMDLIIEVEL